LHEELIKRSNLEFELYQIKNSLAWKALTKYRSLRDKLIAAGTRRLTCYELVRDSCKVLLLKVKPLILQPQTVSVDCQSILDYAIRRSGFGLIQADATLAIVPDGVTNISSRGSVRTGDT
jgi:hypothetical protein